MALLENQQVKESTKKVLIIGTVLLILANIFLVLLRIVLPILIAAIVVLIGIVLYLKGNKKKNDSQGSDQA